MMATLEQRNHARSYLKKAEEYLASAEANLQAGRYTVAAGDAIHAGICAKDAIVTELNAAPAGSFDPAFTAVRRVLPGSELPGVARELRPYAPTMAA